MSTDSSSTQSHGDNSHFLSAGRGDSLGPAFGTEQRECQALLQVPPGAARLPRSRDKPGSARPGCPAEQGACLRFSRPYHCLRRDREFFLGSNESPKLKGRKPQPRGSWPRGTRGSAALSAGSCISAMRAVGLGRLERPQGIAGQRPVGESGERQQHLCRGWRGTMEPGQGDSVVKREAECI